MWCANLLARSGNILDARSHSRRSVIPVVLSDGLRMPPRRVTSGPELDEPELCALPDGPMPGPLWPGYMITAPAPMAFSGREARSRSMCSNMQPLAINARRRGRIAGMVLWTCKVGAWERRTRVRALAASLAVELPPGCVIGFTIRERERARTRVWQVRAPKSAQRLSR